jgi:hypothetical protein
MMLAETNGDFDRNWDVTPPQIESGFPEGRTGYVLAGSPVFPEAAHSSLGGGKRHSESAKGDTQVGVNYCRPEAREM